MENGSKILITLGVWLLTLGYYLKAWNAYGKVILAYCFVIACLITVVESDKIGDTIFDKLLILNDSTKIHYRKFIALVIGFPGLFALDYNFISLGSIMMILGSLIRLFSNDNIDVDDDYNTCYSMLV